MLQSIRSFFHGAMFPAEDNDQQARKGDLRLAACALLLELAYADEAFSEHEREHLVTAIRRQFGVDETEADALIRLADEERRKAVDLWQFTRLIADNYSLGQKMVLAEIMWGLVYSDGELASREDYLMRRISGLLRLEPAYLAEARKKLDQGMQGMP